MKKPKFALIHGIINIILPVVVVLLHTGMFGSAENAWEYFGLAILIAILPVVSSLAGIIIASIQLRKTPASTNKIGLLLSWIGLIIHIVFRFVLHL